MSQYFTSGTRPDVAAGAIAQHLRVKTTGALVVATASDVSLGTMLNPATAAGPCTVLLANAQGTRKMVALDAITKGNAVYAAAGGKVAASGTVVEGRAMEASGADNDVIEVMALANTDIAAATAGTTAAVFTFDSDSGAAKVSVDTNSATGNFTAKIVPPNLSGNVTLTLPAATGTLATLAGTEVLSGKTLTTPVIGAATGTSVAVTGLISSSSATAGIGYATGAGDAATQLTDRSTTVVCTGLSGAITTDDESLATGAEVSFTVTNTSVAIGDVVIANIRSGPTTLGSTQVSVTAVAAGSFQLTLNNLHASIADTGAAIINFAVIKAVSA